MPAATTPESPSSPLKPRDPALDFSGGLPRHWMGGSALATAIATGANLLFPAGERFFVRSVRHYRDQVRTPALRDQLKGFYGQEGLHARETQKMFEAIEANGYDVQRFLALYEAVAYGLIERVSPPVLRLATTAACEHFTALLAEDTLKGGIVEEAPEVMQRLLLWHSAEEIEHRAVAFDVLREVNDSYAWRMAGLAMATACLGGFWALAATMLLAQEKELGPARFLREVRRFRDKRRGREDVFGRGIRAYLKRDFHPSQSGLDQLARSFFAEAGLA